MCRHFERNKTETTSNEFDSCKKMVNHMVYSDEEDSQEYQFVNYKQKYRTLKKNLRYLIYENECFQDELRKAQYNFVSISRDKSFLLDRILNYEKPQGPSSDSEATESSDEDDDSKVASSTSQFFSQRKKITKRKRPEAEGHNGNLNVPSEAVHSQSKQLQMKPLFTKPICGKSNLIVKKSKKPPSTRKPAIKKEKDVPKPMNDKSVVNSQVMKSYDINNVQIANEEQVDTSEQELPHNTSGAEFGFSSMSGSEGHLTREEVERHLESRRFSPELNTTATVPAELFSHEPDPGSDFEDGEICEFIQLEEDATTDVILE